MTDAPKTLVERLREDAEWNRVPDEAGFPAGLADDFRATAKLELEAATTLAQSQARIAELEKERDQQERFKWKANERADVIRQVARSALDNCMHPRCMYDRKLAGYSDCAGGHLAKQVDAAIDAALKDRA